ncbi:trace amine-associated receptor 13c-like [Polypterus senegalus]|uniref:trace amine-associated receptor 13c-like n=1 Tax=Polypterus senegalus TaxID=55291 RepID=UPI001964A760|nr:trace amine-associated receptor 13c-like [Polypterus senegalus]
MAVYERRENQKFQYCFQSGNITCLKETRSTEVYVILYIFSSTVVMLTICGNLVVIISISHFKQLHTPTNFLVLSLAVADFLVGVIVMPFTIIRAIETCWYFGNVFCSIHTVFFLLLTSVSISNLVFIAVDRYFAVCDPFFYSNKITIPVTILFIALSWLISLFYTLAIIHFKGYIEDVTELNICPGDCVFVFNSTWGTIDMFVTFLFPFTLMISFYTKIFFVAKKHARIINSMTQHTESSERKESNIPKKSERKAAKTLGIVVVVFILCWVPYYISTLLVPYMHVDDPSLILQAFAWIAYCNSSMNPIIYALFYPWFQKSLRLIVTLKICNQGSSLINLFPDI